MYFWRWVLLLVHALQINVQRRIREKPPSWPSCVIFVAFYFFSFSTVTDYHKCSRLWFLLHRAKSYACKMETVLMCKMVTVDDHVTNNVTDSQGYFPLLLIPCSVTIYYFLQINTDTRIKIIRLIEVLSPVFMLHILFTNYKHVFLLRMGYVSSPNSSVQRYQNILRMRS